MRQAITILAAALAAAVTPAAAQSGVEIKGGFSYGNVSNRGLLPGELRERTGFELRALQRETGAARRVSHSRQLPLPRVGVRRVG